ncbi:MAG: hydroxymethylbilane synthase [Actinomycetota bacterium]|nr:hydroxymethylbilane synthase [Actinomycetota bacterium]
MRPGSPLRIATRRSEQARSQAQAVADQIAGSTGIDTELVFVDTGGDRNRDVPLHSIGGQGVFVKEVQYAVLEHRADIAVHSAKDLPTEPMPGLTIGAFCARRDAADALVGAALTDLVPGCTVATGSVRRRAQLGWHRPGLRFVELRGNIATRLERIPPGGAIVMAAAALEILGLTDRIAERLDPGEYIPAVGQGAVAVEHRADDADVAEMVALVDHDSTRHAVEVERAFLAELGSGCSLPLGAFVDGALFHTFLSDAEAKVVDQRKSVLALTPADLDTARAVARLATQAIGQR